MATKNRIAVSPARGRTLDSTVWRFSSPPKARPAQKAPAAPPMPLASARVAAPSATVTAKATSSSGSCAPRMRRNTSEAIA